MNEKQQPATPPTMIQLGGRVVLALGLIALVLVSLWLWLSWTSLKKNQIQRMAVASGLIAAHAANFFDFVGSDLARLGDDLSRTQALQYPDAALILLRRFKAAHPDLVGATIILPDGRILASTQLKEGETPPNVLSNPEWRDDFARDLQSRGLSIDQPQLSYLVQQWIIPLRYAVRDEGGRVQFLIQTSILLEKQQSLWRHLDFPKDVAIGLLRQDGYLISRYPDTMADTKAYRRKLLDGPLVRAMADNKHNGSYQGRTVDGLLRFGAYHRLPEYPLVAFISLPQSEFLSLWWQGVSIPLYLILGAFAASMGGYGLLARRFASRMRDIQHRLREAGHGNGQGPLPSSGVAEIDTLVGSLAESRRRLQQMAHNREKLLLDAAEAGTYAVRSRDGVVVAADRAFLDMLGMDGKQVIGSGWDALMESDLGGSGITRGPSGMARRIFRFRRGDGTMAWLSLAEYQEDVDGEMVRQGLAIDVSDRETLFSTVRMQSERLRALWQLATADTRSDTEKIESLLDLGLECLGMDAALISEVADGRLIVRYAADHLGLFAGGQQFDLADTLCGLVVSSGASVFLPDLSADERSRSHPLVTEMGVNAYASVPIREGSKLYGTLALVQKNASKGFSEDDRVFMELLASWFGQSLYQQRQHQALERLALTDSLTGLPNRRAAESRFQEELARARRSGEAFAIAICDLDRFKLINDHFGHDIGDEVLRQVAIAMREALREGDWVARWGGEEFIVFLHQSQVGNAYAAMERLREQVKTQPVTTRQGQLEVTISIGIGVLRDPQEDVARVLSEADGCLYEAKKSGRDRVVVGEGAKQYTLWKAGMLQRALLENRLVPAYQVIVDLRTGEVVADETLARLVQPDGEIVAAGEFIEAAEGINLIHVVDQTMAWQSMSRCAAYLGAGKSQEGIAHFVNLSPQFLARRELVRALLKDAEEFCSSCGVEFTGFKPLVFEITERQFLGDFRELIKDLQPLLDFGFRLALDDFGSGYSSFLYLAELPFSFLKIEGWMVQNMRTNPRVMAMVRSIVHLARSQGIVTIGECIEDRETADLLRDIGVDWGQGYYFGHPVCAMPTVSSMSELHAVKRN